MKSNQINVASTTLFASRGGKLQKPVINLNI